MQATKLKYSKIATHKGNAALAKTKLIHNDHNIMAPLWKYRPLC